MFKNKLERKEMGRSLMEHIKGQEHTVLGIDPDYPGTDVADSQPYGYLSVAPSLCHATTLTGPISEGCTATFHTFHLRFTH